MEPKKIEEIKTSYRDAKNKVEQINILAECFATTTGKIRKILFDAGLYPIDAEVMRRIDAYLNKKNVNYANLRNYIGILHDYGAKDIRSLIADWNEAPWGFEEFKVGTPIKARGGRVKVYEFPEAPAEQKNVEEQKTENPIEQVDGETYDIVMDAINSKIVNLEEKREEYQKKIQKLESEIKALTQFFARFSRVNGKDM